MPRSRKTYERINPAEWAPVRGKGGNTGWANRETGERISNRQYRNRLVGESIEAYRGRPERITARLSRTDFKNPYTGQAAAAYRDYEKHWRQTHGFHRGKATAPVPGRYSPEFQDILDALASKPRKPYPKGKETGPPHGRKAKALEKLGRRKPGWDFPVGATPK